VSGRMPSELVLLEKQRGKIPWRPRINQEGGSIQPAKGLLSVVIQYLAMVTEKRRQGDMYHFDAQTCVR
jgi:hypothetical protein